MIRFDFYQLPDNMVPRSRQHEFSASGASGLLGASTNLAWEQNETAKRDGRCAVQRVSSAPDERS
jgi:hypothetical protein